ncbi:RNAse P, Rpr2/Rpp21 subunit [Artemisia annua]|uniref:RNAse P, Rpr2/Rpp21 subunit n=1 Tax=Artemisia annua TaxID=35608 RepID=A0A2U1KVN4_ARTAN|nr:RNAse P, Rpr2/Rpp21 subunit [Artemisia annua]
MLDSLIHVILAAGHNNIPLVVTETGWPYDPYNIAEATMHDEDDGSLGTFSTSLQDKSLNSMMKHDYQQSLSIHLPKSLSSRLEQPHSPTLESGPLKANSPKTHLTPFRKMFDPFVKSNSQKISISTSKKNTLRKSLIYGFSNAGTDPTLARKILFWNNNRMPYFEFLVKNSNDVLVAKTKKVGNELVNAYNSMVTEFVSYDLAHSQKSGFPIPEKTYDSKESTGQSKVHVDQKIVADVHPALETAALMKNEPTTVSVVISSGNHGLPSDESHGPSPLLDRWRLGGGCDCGGWDMGCPLIVLGNPNIQEDKSVWDSDGSARHELKSIVCELFKEFLDTLSLAENRIISEKVPAATSGPQMSVTMRKASTGKKQINVKSSLKLQHLKDLAVWASHDAAIPSLGAFFGHHFAASSEALGSPVDPSLFACQRCESMLHPGFNCTIRIEKNKTNSRHKGKKTTNHPRNNIVYTCNFCSHRNMKRGTPQNTSQQKDKTNPKSTNNKSNNTLSSFKSKAPKYKDNVVANVIAAPLGSTPDEPSRSRMGNLETLKVKGKSTDMNHIAASLGSRADNPGRGNMGILQVCETLKVKDNFADINTKAASIRSTVDSPIGNFGIIEMSETLEARNDSIASGPNADDLEGGKMGVLEISETLKVINEPTASAPNEDDPDRGKMDTLEISETLKVIEDFTDINTTSDDLRGNIGVVEISETLEVKNDNAASGPVTPLTKPTLTLLDSKKKNRNRSAAKKTPAPNSTSEAPNVSTSNRRRRKSWTSLKEIAKNNEKSRRLF